MRQLFLSIAIVLLSVACSADDRPISFDQLPQAAKELINQYYPGEKVSYAEADDDRRPDYEVVLENGVRFHFENDGSLEKIETPTGVPEGLVPVQIRDYVNANYQEFIIIEYEVGRKTYEVKLSNRLELKFDTSFKYIGFDD
jgi:hypothetical protein